MNLKGIDRRTVEIFVGVLLIGGSLLAYPGAIKDEHYTGVTEVNESSIRDEEVVHDFSDLSPRAQELFLNALNDTDGRVVFKGESKQPSEFNYYDDTVWYTYVYHDGDYYTVTGRREDCLGHFCYIPHLIIGTPLLGGLLLVVYSLVRRKRVYDDK